MDERDTKLYPAWRQAESDLLAQGVTFGSIITTEWLDEAFGIRQAKTIAEHEKNELVFLRQMTALRESLLESRKMMLVSEPGVGYRVALPEEQTKLSMHVRTREIKSAMGKLLREVSNVAQDKLSDDQRKENSDAMAKLGSLRVMLRKQLKKD
jgi:hypothetical protein